ncbi:MAG: response regulator [Spirochaetaceae bacterium]|jgi:signal transduction histidine kinase/CheY-like chemotaxis protein|nr:response regulator [Spirochaetaceae bacterium]
MNKIKELIRRYVLSDEVPLEAKMINTIFLAGISFASMAIVTRFLMGAGIFLLLVVLAIVLSIICLMAACNRFRLYTVFSWLAIIVVCDILLPTAYFALGGVASSAPVYFVLSIVIIALLSKGKSSVVFLITHIMWIIFCYYISYRFPNLVIHQGAGPDDFAIYQKPRIYLDHIQSIIIVGGCIGFIIKIQNKIYLLERDKVDDSRRQVLLRDKLLHMVNDAAVMLIASEEGQFEESLRKSMESMARCVDVDRICIWKNQVEGEPPRYLKLVEWLEDRGLWWDKGDANTLPVYFDGIPEWEREFSRGHLINGPLKNLSPAEQSLLPSPDLVSILAIPIFLQDQYWGFVSFGNYREERRFSAQEEDILQSGSLLIANAVARNEMTRNLIQAREEALTSTRAKSIFLARMSHEIRTPLNAIIGLADAELGKSPAGETGEHLQDILSSGSVLLAIINDLLDISKIESGRLELIPVEYDPLDLLKDCIKMNIIRIGSKPVQLEVDISESLPSRLYGDEVRVKQVLNNILSNACKYTETGKIILRVRCEDKGEDLSLIISVEDSGPGIRKEHLDILFSEYRRLDERTNRNIEGTGLGLSISKKLAELMDGHIGVESTYGKGSVFTVLIRQKITDHRPVGKAAVLALRDTENRRESRKGPQAIAYFQKPDTAVLVVDDMLTNLRVAKALLKPYGLAVYTAISGEQAIDIIRAAKTRFELIFMDHMMPGIDGIETVRIIRDEIESDYIKTIPVIALTANAIAGNDKMFLENGFQGFLSKPIDTIKLDAILRTWLLEER